MAKRGGKERRGGGRESGVMADIAIMARVLEAPSRYNLQLLHFLGKWLALLACSGAARRGDLL